jgi:hypothetical protein
MESRDLYDLLLERYRTGSVIVTSNRGPDQWLATFADPVRVQSAIDRFTSNAYDLVIEGESYPTATQAPARQGSEAALAMRPTPCHASRGGTRRQADVGVASPSTAAARTAGPPSTLERGESVDRLRQLGHPDGARRVLRRVTSQGGEVLKS